MSTLSILEVVVPVFCVLAIGFGLRKMKILTMEADQSLFGITVNLLVPCLILHVVVDNPALENRDNLLVAPLLGFFSVVLGCVIAWAAASLLNLKDGSGKRAFTLATALFNYGYLAIPMVGALFGRDTMGVLFLFNLGVETSMWTVGVLVLRGGRLREGARQLLNTPIVAIVCAVILHHLGAGSWTPVMVQKAVGMLADCAIPLALLLVGASFYDHIGGLSPRHSWKAGLGGCLLRLGLLPLAFLAAGKWLPLSLELKQVLIVQAGMPSAMFTVVLCKRYGGDISTALLVIMATTLAGLLTIPLWIKAGISWVAP